MSESTAADLWEWLAECVTCGKAHEWRKSGYMDLQVTWASPDDGHTYRRRWWVPEDVRAAWDDAQTGKVRADLDPAEDRLSDPVMMPLREWVIVLCPDCGVECVAPVMRRYAEWGSSSDDPGFRLLLDTAALERHVSSHRSVPAAPDA